MPDTMFSKCHFKRAGLLARPGRLLVGAFAFLKADSAAAEPVGPGDQVAGASRREVQDGDARSPSNDAADVPLVTDRPDFTESTQTIPARWFQLEGGYTFTYDREGQARVREHSAPELLLRLGLAERMEFRLGWTGYTWSELHREVKRESGRRVSEERWTQGGEDLSIGAKFKLLDQAGWRPDFGVLVQVSAPSGSLGFSSGDVDPEIKLLWAYALSERLSLAGNLNLGVPTEDAHRFVQSSASISLAASLFERVGMFTEYFGFYPNAHGDDCAHYINGGLTFLLTDDFQIDARVGAGLNDVADDFFTGVGFAWRVGS